MTHTDEHDMYYRALGSRDARFDGLFFAGISSTGIYCRPVCTVRRPKQENCTFFPSAAAAEAAGYRPCMRCRPELAPGLSSVDSTQSFAKNAVALMDTLFTDENCLMLVAEQLGISTRHLRRVVQAHFGVSPVQYLQTRRLLYAKNLLTDTPLPITDIAMASGFGSLRRFHALFAKHYRMTPGALRKGLVATQAAPDEVSVLLGYRPPYDWAGVLHTLGQQAVPGCEAVDAATYTRTAALQKGDKLHTGWFSVSDLPKKNALRLRVSLDLLPVFPALCVRIKALFDTDCSPLDIAAALSPHLPDYNPGTRVCGSFDLFETAVKVLLADAPFRPGVLAARFVERFGTPLATAPEGLKLLFPTAQQLLVGDAAAQMAELGIDAHTAGVIAAAAQAVADGAISPLPGSSFEQLADALVCCGATAEQAAQIATQALLWPDTPLLGHCAQAAEQLRPWRSYASFYELHRQGGLIQEEL